MFTGCGQTYCWLRLKTWEPTRATDSVKTAERPLQHGERYKWQWSTFPFFHSRSHVLKHANQLTASPLCGKFTSAYYKIFKFTVPSPELKFIWMSLCAIPRRFRECCPLWVYAWRRTYSVMSFLWNDLDELIVLLHLLRKFCKDKGCALVQFGHGITCWNHTIDSAKNSTFPQVWQYTSTPLT